MGALERVAYLEAALRKIAKREGRYSRDHHQHAANTIEDMAAVAEKALAGTWDAPSSGTEARP